MKKKCTIMLLAAMCCLSTIAKPASDKDKVNALEEICGGLQSEQERTIKELYKLKNKQKMSEQSLLLLTTENAKQSEVIDSLQKVCKQLGEMQDADRKNMTGKLDATDCNVRENQDMLQRRSLWSGITAIVFLVIILGVAYRLTKRIKSGNSSIDEVRKAQETLQAAYVKMQEESVKLDDKLLELFDRQLSNTPKIVGNEKQDHSLTLKVADEIVRIELNMSRMDSSVKGYKQLSKAVERIKDNFKANGYEIVDMLGKPYNEGMKVIANFVSDEKLDEGTQIITGITKPQINYNGQMIQAAQITVSQNI